MTIAKFKEIFKPLFPEINIIWEEKYLNDLEDVKYNGTFWVLKFNHLKRQCIYPKNTANTNQNLDLLATKLDLKLNSSKRRTQETFKDVTSGFNIRLEFISSVGNDWGRVLALRFSRISKMYELYDPKIINILQSIIQKDVNIIIGGKTGSGKTALQKFVLSLINPNEGIFLLEDTQDTSLKELYPNLDITALNIRDNIKYYENDLIHGFKSAKRFNPDWIILSEATDKLLKKHLCETMLSSHKTITTIHNSNIKSTINDLALAIATKNDNINDLETKVAQNIGYFIFCNYKINENGSYIRYIDHISYINKDLNEEIIYKSILNSNELNVINSNNDTKSTFRLNDLNKWDKYEKI